MGQPRNAKEEYDHIVKYLMTTQCRHSFLTTLFICLLELGLEKKSSREIWRRRKKSSKMAKGEERRGPLPHYINVVVVLPRRFTILILHFFLPNNIVMNYKTIHFKNFDTYWEHYINLPRSFTTLILHFRKCKIRTLSPNWLRIRSQTFPHKHFQPKLWTQKNKK